MLYHLKKTDLDFLAETCEPRRGSRAMIRTTVRHPQRGSHPPRRGGRQDPSWAMDPHTTRVKARGSETDPSRLRHQITEPTMGRGLDDEPWMGSSSLASRPPP
uniref:Uncharacterized protein n=1 Tax=Solanum tuberosum TaxID=4113 RepID=M1DK46_SOLTU